MDSHAFFRYVLSSLDNSVAAVFLTFLGDNFTTPFYKVVIASFSGPFFVLVFVPIFILVCLRHNVSNLIKTLVLVEVVLLGLSFGFVVLSIFLVSTFEIGRASCRERVCQYV